MCICTVFSFETWKFNAMCLVLLECTSDYHRKLLSVNVTPKLILSSLGTFNYISDEDFRIAVLVFLLVDKSLNRGVISMYYICTVCWDQE